MSNIASKRIQKELSEFRKADEIHIEPQGDDLMHLTGFISGPPDTPYYGAKFNLEIIIPVTYPFSPPKVKFTTKIWHPNVSSATGVICLDVLKDQWAAAMSLRTVLLSIQALLASPEPDDPQDAVVANQLKTSPHQFRKTAQYWAAVHANGPTCDADCAQRLEQLVHMGFSEHESLCALSSKNWNVAEATEFLIK